MSQVFTLETLNKMRDRPPLEAHAVPVPEFGAGMVAWIAKLEADERDERVELPWLAFQESRNREDGVGFRAFAVAACWCHGQSRDFMAKTAEEITKAAVALGKQDSVPVTRMFQAADKLNGFSKIEIEGIEKNSPPAGDGSGTSPSTPDSAAPESSSAG